MKRWARKWMALLLALLLAALVSCGDSPSEPAEEGGDGVTSGAAVGSVSLASTVTKGMTANGTDSYTVTALVMDIDGNPLSEKPLTFTILPGSTGLALMSNPSAPTAVDGSVITNVTDISGTDDIVNITASCEGVSAPFPLALSFAGTGTGGGSGSDSSLILTADSPVFADGATAATITARLTDVDGNPMEGVLVSLSASGSAIVRGTPKTTNDSGVASFAVTDTVAETVILTATVDDTLTTTDDQIFIPLVASVTPISVNPPSASAPASGLDTIQITFQVLNGASPPEPVANQTIVFGASGGEGGAVAMSPTTATTNSEGLVSVTVSNTTAENVSVSASTSGVAGTQVVTFTPLDPANIILSSSTPDPPVISISGVGSQESATLFFQIVDVNNNPVQGSHMVDFDILQGGLNGGEALTTWEASTVNAMVSTVLNSGIKAGTLQVRASLRGADPPIFADVTITIHGGLPAGNTLGLAAEPLNIFGRWLEGLTQDVIVSVADYYSNPIAPNVQVQFQTDFAHISGSDTFVPVVGEDAAEGAVGNASKALATVTSPGDSDDQAVDGFVNAVAQTIGGVHAKVMSLAVHPNNPNIIYAGTDGGGVFKTIDGGKNWTHVGTPLKEIGTAKFPNLLGGMVRDLQIDPAHPSVLYAGTDKGVFVSINAGEDWRSLTGLRRAVGDNLGVASGLPIGADGLGQEAFTFSFQSTGVRSRTRIYLTTDEGTFATENYILTNDAIGFINNPGSVFPPAGTVVSADYDTVSSLPNLPIYAVAVDHDTYNPELGYANTVYAGLYGGGVWKTSTGGRRWFRASTMKPGSAVTFGANVISLALNSSNPDQILSGSDGEGLFKTTSAAAEWEKVTGIDEAVIQDVLFTSLDGGGRIWVAGKNGIHYSTDGGLTWNEPSQGVNATDPTNTDVRALARDPIDGTLYAATFGDVLDESSPHGGVYSSDDDGDTWSLQGKVLSAAREGAHFMDTIAVFGRSGPDILFTGSEGRLIARKDGDNDWEGIVGSPPNNLTNVLFSTIRLMHSGEPLIQILPMTATYQPMNNYFLGEPIGYGAFTSLYHSRSRPESHGFYVRISDDLGHRLPAGTRIWHTVDGKNENSDLTVSGNIGTLANPTILSDGTYGKTDFYVEATNSRDFQDSAFHSLDVWLNYESPAEEFTIWTSVSFRVLGVFTAEDTIVRLTTQGRPLPTTVVESTKARGGSETAYIYRSDAPEAVLSSPLGTEFEFPNGQVGLLLNYGDPVDYTYTVPEGYDGSTVLTDTIRVTDLATGEEFAIPVEITR